jgi:hypothetical protein
VQAERRGLTGASEILDVALYVRSQQEPRE